MKPEPDPQSDGKRPKPRRGFIKENRSEDALEKDLWDLDEPVRAAASEPDAPEGEEPSAEEPGKNQEGRTQLPITPRSTRRDLVFKQSPPKKRPAPQAPADGDNDTRPYEEGTPGGSSERSATPAESDEAFVDLEGSPNGETVPQDTPDSAKEPTPPGAPEPVENENAPAPAAAVPNAVVKLSKGLSKMERMGLVGFLALVLGGLLFFLAYSVNKLPEDQKPLTPGDLPIAGKIISADKISSYWREPDISAGETVRRGTLLLPVVELGVSGGPGAVRVLFRDSDGAIVGDGVTRPVNGEGTVTIVATAGFDDQGMFAAYRTGETKPWKIEVLEGNSENASGNNFKKIFEIPISTQRR
jgi:hypothetical protein